MIKIGGFATIKRSGEFKKWDEIIKNLTPLELELLTGLGLLTPKEVLLDEPIGPVKYFVNFLEFEFAFQKFMKEGFVKALPRPFATSKGKYWIVYYYDDEGIFKSLRGSPSPNFLFLCSNQREARELRDAFEKTSVWMKCAYPSEIAIEILTGTNLYIQVEVGKPQPEDIKVVRLDIC
jgi:hypothetical protein